MNTVLQILLMILMVIQMVYIFYMFYCTHQSEKRSKEHWEELKRMDREFSEKLDAQIKSQVETLLLEESAEDEQEKIESTTEEDTAGENTNKA